MCPDRVVIPRIQEHHTNQLIFSLPPKPLNTPIFIQVSQHNNLTNRFHSCLKQIAAFSFSLVSSFMDFHNRRLCPNKVLQSYNTQTKTMK